MLKSLSYPTLVLALSAAGCFDFSPTPFGEESYRCWDDGTCDAGLVCNDAFRCVDPCKNIRCSGHGGCLVENGGPTCACDIGYVSSDVECLEIGSLGAPCGPSSTCNVGLVCSTNSICTEACAQLACGEHGQCQLIGTEAHCVCDGGFHEASLTCVDDCADENCSGHGECSMASGNAACICDSGFSPSGLNCVQDGCVANGSTTTACEAGQLYNYDSCNRRLEVHTNCGARGCADGQCNPVSWVGYGSSELGPWTVYQDLATVGLSGVSRTASAANGLKVGLDGLDRPMVGWSELAGGTGKIWFRRWTGTAWAGPDMGAGTDALPDTPYGQYGTFTVGTNTLPVMAWMAALGMTTAGDTRYKIIVREWNGSSWASIGDSATTGLSFATEQPSSTPSIGMLGGQWPVVAWMESVGSGRRIWVSRWTGSQWTGLQNTFGTSDTISNTSLTAFLPSLAADSSGRVVVSFVEDGKLVASSFSHGAWARLGTTVSASGYYPTVCLSTAHDAVVAWISGSGSASEVFLKHWDGSNWVEFAGSASGGGVSSGARESSEPTVACTTTNEVFLSWAEETASGAREIFLKRWDGSAWSEFPTGSATLGGVSNDSGDSRYPSVSVSDSKACVAWASAYGTSGNSEVFVRCATR